MSQIAKVCPLVLRQHGADWQILAFRHPLAGCQLVKGTLEAGETVVDGALRELCEEAGVAGTLDTERPIWSNDGIVSDQVWHFVSVRTPALPDTFAFRTEDDGGHVFSFFWWPLQDEPDSEWHPIFVRTLAEIRLHYR